MVPLAASAMLAAASSPALAQRRGRVVAVRPAVRPVVVAGGWGWRYPGAYYDPFYYGGWQGPWGYYPPYPYYGVRDDLTASVRVDMQPRQAEVFVDGYRAGVVDDFDGVFQRLRLRPGPHEITILLSGYRTVTRSMYFGPGTDQKIQETLVPLAGGERSEPPPAPSPEDRTQDRPDRPAPPDRRMPPPDRGPDRGPEPSMPDAERPARFGTLSLRVQPSDAAVTIDGQSWTPASGEPRLGIQLSEGRHHIEVRKDGFRTYSEDILVRRDTTFTLNVNLTRN